MIPISRSRLLAKNRCRCYYQVGNSYCPIGAFMSEYLGRDDLGIIQADGFFDAPEEVMNLLFSLAGLNPNGLRRYSDVSDASGSLVENWVNALGALLWDAERNFMITLVD